MIHQSDLLLVEDLHYTEWYMWLSFLLPSALLFVIGVTLGSFINVLIYRSLDEAPRRRGDRWFKGRSRCDHCHQQIAWYDNVPLLSFLFLSGKCRSCQKRISLNHPIVELLTGTLFVWWYWAMIFFLHLTKGPFGFFQPLFWLLVGLILLYVFLTDAWYYLIPDTAVAVLTVLVVLYRGALVLSGVMQVRDLGLSLLATVVVTTIMGLIWLGTKGKGLGLGDVKIMIPLGLLLGWPSTFVMLFLAFVLGGIYGMVALATRRKKWGQVVPFGPFIIISTWVSLVWGEQLLASYLRILGI